MEDEMNGNDMLALAVLDEMIGKISTGKAGVRSVSTEGPRYDVISHTSLGGQNIRHVGARGPRTLTFTIDDYS
jgi:hypothetical protein